MKRRCLWIPAALVLLFALLCACEMGNMTNGSGEHINGTKGLEYVLSPDGEAYLVSGIGTASGEKVVIPHEHKGKPVIGIDAGAFDECTDLTSVIIPSTVTSIGHHAFYNCSGLRSITIPGSVTSISGHVFAGCESLTSITIPDCVTNLGPYCFSRCSSLRSITIPDGVTSIGYGAFWLCTNLTSITIGDSVTTIGHDAFSGCTGLTSITVPNSVTSIGSPAFGNCDSLSSITVDENNPVYHSAGNCLIETKSKTLIAGCKTSIIPSDGSVTSIGNAAFSGCTSLASITIPDSVTSIADLAFVSCANLTSINFWGTMSEWDAVSKGFYWNADTGAYTVYCTDGTITK